MVRGVYTPLAIVILNGGKMKLKKITLTKKALKQLAKLCRQYPVDFYLLNRAGANSSEILDVVSKTSHRPLTPGNLTASSGIFWRLRLLKK